MVLWPDNDEPGRAHMQQVEKILQRLEPAPRIAILEPADLDLGHKEDVVDYVKQLETLGNDKSQIQAAILEFLNTAKPRGIACGVSELIEDTIVGRRVAVKWPWAYVGGLTKALQPGTVTIICGNVGASKSFMLLEAGAYRPAQESRIEAGIEAQCEGRFEIPAPAGSREKLGSGRNAEREIAGGKDACELY